ncbi:MAG: hypothetical protein HYY06_25670 [Deltaproteobacteria bacterium]|nr:hypothetical protein [Deltaproteobacteria bacterium]
MIRSIVALCLILGAGQAIADSREVEARRLFETATLALQTGRVAEARDLLRRSLALYPNAPTAFNLAVALRGTGETLESIELFDAILSGRHGPLGAEQAAEAARLRAETAREVAHVDVHASGAERIAIRVDGRPAASLPDGGRADIPVDAGAHELRASAPGRVPARHHVRIDRGARAAWNLNLALAAPDAAGAALQARNGGRSSPWLWVGLGGLLAGAVLAAAFVLASGGEAEPVRDPIFGVVEALTAGP